ncbi:MAG TPA: DNA internalization-related competence protein ComEC/Rec2 [Candidatus Binatia bacterium]|nr:DNA internalization-related competence protein ComEC/Rec2 [Candidatus Binatia bacterium]
MSIALTVTYLVGQVCAAWGWFVSPLWLGGFALFSTALWCCGGRRLAGLVGGLLLVFSLANFALRSVLLPSFPPGHLRQLRLPQEVTLEGWLFREPERFPRHGRLYVEAQRVWQGGVPHPASGKILVTVRTLAGPWRYGDVLQLSLRLRAPRNFHTPGSFDYEGYLARQGIYLSAFLWDDSAVRRTGEHGDRMRAWIEQARRTIGGFFDAQLDKQTAAVLRALIIGDEGQVDKDLRQAFSRTGVAHVLSISGLHIGLVATAAYGLWWWLLGRSCYLLLTWTMPKLAAVLSVPPVLLYASLAGGNVATWRSVVMVLVYLLAVLLDRQQEVYRSLALAALLISLIWPGAVLDISFQLSFLSVLSILLGMERFTRWWAEWSERRLLNLSPRRERVWRWGATYIAVAGFALLGTAPATAAHFNQITLAGVFANLLIVPLLGSLAVISGLAAAGLLFLHAGLATLVLFCAGLVTRAGTWLVTWLGAWPYAALTVVTPTLLELVLVYGLFACLLFQSAFRNPLRPGPSTGHALRYLLPALILALFLDGTFWAWHRYFHHDLRVTFLDVGQGDATVVELPGSQVMVIDGGGFASEDFDVGEAVLAPFLWSRKIGRVDMLVMSHPQLDHYGGLMFLAERFAPREFWFNGERAQGERFQRLLSALDRAGVTVRALCRETPEMRLAQVRVHILHPPCRPAGFDTNNASLVLRLSYGVIDLLFTGDIETNGERALLSADGTLSSEILKVPHHGSRTSSSKAFVEAATPQVAVASLGYHNRFAFPASEVVLRYAEQGARFLRTDEVGAITVVTDGRSYWVETALP